MPGKKTSTLEFSSDGSRDAPHLPEVSIFCYNVLGAISLPKDFPVQKWPINLRSRKAPKSNIPNSVWEASCHVMKSTS